MQRGDEALEARSQKSDHYLIDIASSLKIGCQPTFHSAVFMSLPSSHLCLCFSPVTVISKTLICDKKSPPACSRKFVLMFCTHVQGTKTGKADSLACVQVLKESRSLDSTTCTGVTRLWKHLVRSQIIISSTLHHLSKSDVSQRLIRLSSSHSRPHMCLNGHQELRYDEKSPPACSTKMFLCFARMYKEPRPARLWHALSSLSLPRYLPTVQVLMMHVDTTCGTATVRLARWKLG